MASAECHSTWHLTIFRHRSNFVAFERSGKNTSNFWNGIKSNLNVDSCSKMNIMGNSLRPYSRLRISRSHGNPRLKPGATRFGRIRGGAGCFVASAEQLLVSPRPRQGFCDSLVERAERVAPRFSVGYGIKIKPSAVERWEKTPGLNMAIRATAQDPIPFADNPSLSWEPFYCALFRSGRSFWASRR